jgi:hypothetical protein
VRGGERENRRGGERKEREKELEEREREREVKREMGREKERETKESFEVKRNVYIYTCKMSLSRDVVHAQGDVFIDL